MFFKKSEQKEIINEFVLEVIDDVFKISFVTFLTFALFELWRPGFAVNYLNMNLLLVLVLASGMASLILNKENNK